ncbi:ectoine utilization protein EutE [Streptomyces scabiei]|uniref:succinylglutamate desuccinylase/aspartoacylase family protein n=1 Tax=Streptomyces scabiei TaxID=1930 RepID=UPI0004E66852|nr:M14 family metallopeptidase [Streptomyces scabiei]KFF99103.1 ectoine utilization protein EutE [Streptomyces scabiei]
MYSIGPLTVAPGERAQGLIPVGTSSYGVELGIPLIVVNGTEEGPVLCVDAGVHGDEYDGQEAIRRVLAEIDPATLRGTVVGIPCMNTPAFEAAARAGGLDHLNLNRIFPGDAEGSYSQRLAATFVEQVVPAVDAVVDLHTGGAYGEIAPLVILQGGYEDLATDIALAAGHELVWKGGKWGGTIRHPVFEAGKPAITIECGGATYREANVAHHMNSIRNIMRRLRMTDGQAELRDSYTTVSGTFARSAAGGFFVAHAEPGENCKEGDLIATITDHYGNTLEEVSAPQDGIVLWVRRIRTVHPGDEVVIFGAVEGEIRP